MAIFKKNPNEVMYQGGKKHIAESLENRSPNNTLIYKNPEQDFNNGSTLTVNPGEQAIFVDQGSIVQVFENGAYPLTSENYPFLSRLRNALTGGISTFHCSVYFVRTAISRALRWGTSKPIIVYDKAYDDTSKHGRAGLETKVQAYGAYSVRVSDAASLLTNLVGNNDELATQDTLDDFLAPYFQQKINAQLSRALHAWDRPLIEFTDTVDEVAPQIQQQLAPLFKQYGLYLEQFGIEQVTILDNENRQHQQEKISHRRDVTLDTEVETEAEKNRYEALGTNYQQVQTLEALKALASNQGGGGSSLMNAGLGLTMGAGLGQALPNLFGQTIQAAQGPVPGQSAQGQPAPSAPPQGAPFQATQSGVPGQGVPQAAQSEAPEQGVPQAVPSTVPAIPTPPSATTTETSADSGNTATDAQAASVPVAPTASTTDAPSPAPPQQSMFDRLSQLKKMLDAGLVSQDEYDAKKSEILKSL